MEQYTNNGRINDILSIKTDYRVNLNHKSVNQLKQMLEQQNKLLTNKRFISKLPDNGEKIKAFCGKLMQMIEEKSQMNDTVSRFENLSLENASEIIANHSMFNNDEMRSVNDNDNDRINDFYTSVITETIDRKNEIKENSKLQFKLNKCKDPIDCDVEMRVNIPDLSKYNDTVLKCVRPSHSLTTLSLNESLKLTETKLLNDVENNRGLSFQNIQRFYINDHNEYRESLSSISVESSSDESDESDKNE